MNSSPEIDSPYGISPVVGAILLISVSIILSSFVGVVVMELTPDSSSWAGSVAVSVAEHDDGISPVVGVIRLVSVFIMLISFVGVVVMELTSDSSSGVGSVAVSVDEHDDGILIRVIESGKALDVVNNGVVVHSFVGESGEEIKVSGVNEGDVVSIVLNEPESPQTVVYTHEVTQSIAVVDGGITVISSASGSSSEASQ